MRQRCADPVPVGSSSALRCTPCPRERASLGEAPVCAVQAEVSSSGIRLNASVGGA